MRTVDIYSRKLIAEQGITVPQLLCLCKLDDLGALAVRDLATAVNLSPSVTTGIIDRLVKQGFCARDRSVRDRRKVFISLTDKGREVVASAPPLLQDHFAEALDTLSELERATIACSLDTVATLLEKRAPEDVRMRAPAAPVLTVDALEPSPRGTTGPAQERDR